MRDDDSRLDIGQIQRNSRDTIVVALTTFQGRRSLDLRVYRDKGASRGHDRTAMGFSLNITKARQLVELINDAIAEASRCGWLEGET